MADFVRSPSILAICAVLDAEGVPISSAPSAPKEVTTFPSEVAKTTTRGETSIELTVSEGAAPTVAASSNNNARNRILFPNCNSFWGTGCYAQQGCVRRACC